MHTTQILTGVQQRPTRHYRSSAVVLCFLLLVSGLLSGELAHASGGGCSVGPYGYNSVGDIPEGKTTSVWEVMVKENNCGTHGQVYGALYCKSACLSDFTFLEVDIRPSGGSVSQTFPNGYAQLSNGLPSGGVLTPMLNVGGNGYSAGAAIIACATVQYAVTDTLSQFCSGSMTVIDYQRQPTAPPGSSPPPAASPTATGGQQASITWVSPTSLNFVAYSNGDTPPPQSVTVRLSRKINGNWSFAATSSWITTIGGQTGSIANGSSFKVSVVIVNTNLLPGTYSATFGLTVTDMSSGVTLQNSPVGVTVTYIVQHSPTYYDSAGHCAADGNSTSSNDVDNDNISIPPQHISFFVYVCPDYSPDFTAYSAFLCNNSGYSLDVSMSLARITGKNQVIEYNEVSTINSISSSGNSPGNCQGHDVFTGTVTKDIGEKNMFTLFMQKTDGTFEALHPTPDASLGGYVGEIWYYTFTAIPPA